MKEETHEKRFAMLLAAKDSDYVIKMYNGYFNVFVQALGDAGETWDLFRVIDGEFPETKDLDKYEGFVISGSPHDAYGDDFWIMRLCLLIQTLHAMQKKVLGICFGHQVLCRALGGRVGKASTGWDIGVREIIMHEKLTQCRFVDKLGELPPGAKLIECHQDEVLEVPPGAEVLASSNKTGVEMFCIGDNMLGIQGHPEYTKDIMYNLIDRIVSNEFIDTDFGDDAKIQLEAEDADRAFWEKLCKGFLKGEDNLYNYII